MQGRDLNESKAAQERPEPEVWMQRDCLHVWECSEWVENGELSVTPLISTAHRQCTAYTDRTNTTPHSTTERTHNMYQDSHATTKLQHRREHTMLYVHQLIMLIENQNTENVHHFLYRIPLYPTDMFQSTEVYWDSREHIFLIWWPIQSTNSAVTSIDTDTYIIMTLPVGAVTTALKALITLKW